MKNKKWAGVLAGFLFLSIADVPLAEAASGAGKKGDGAYAPKVGQPHPDFTLPDIRTGKPVSLSEFRGKKVLLIHMASW